MAVETRRRQIEDAASALFRERGYAATSVRDIAQRLNLQGGSLYAHVSSKEELLWSIACRAADRFHGDVGPLGRSDAPASQRLRRMIRAHVGVVTSAQRDAAVFLHEWRYLSGERRQMIAGRRDTYEALFRAVIADGVTSGEFAPTEPRMSAMLMLSGLNGIATWYRPDGDLTPDQIADQYADLFLRALAVPAAMPEPHFTTRTIT
ncbi:MAG TPA: TetR/AcrR family transcriptional regulator [Candidatus Limnocylindria bacterium]|nr:TetR/AcrR family transcriptional regulator [Candidatus Limnocylindria bacterium]